MVFMSRRAFLEAAAGVLATALWRTAGALEKAATHVIDVMPAFWKFWDTNLHQPMDVRVRAFFESIVAVYPDLFHHGLIISGALTDLEGVPEAQTRVADYLRDVQQYIPAMRRITTEIREKYHRSVADLSKAFPDYAPMTPVYFTVSLFGFSDGMNYSPETIGLYFGIDELARILEFSSNIKIVLDHELFHRYRYQIAPVTSTSRAAWAYMWEEGLATYVSHQMNPGYSVDADFVLPTPLSELAKPHLQELARRMIDQAESVDPQTYSDLFSLDRSPAGMPARSGYYLGFRTAELLASNRSLTELAHLEGDELKRNVLHALVELRSSGRIGSKS